MRKAAKKLVRELLGGTGKTLWLEAPIHFAHGCHDGRRPFLFEFNLTVVDDGRVSIGNSVMFGPNVTISTTGHPFTRITGCGRALFLPVVIEDGVWIGANVVVMPGVTIGKNSVIGAGSVVTRDIPENVVAFGTPCRVVRPITDADLKPSARA